MRRTVAAALALGLTLTLVGCGDPQVGHSDSGIVDGGAGMPPPTPDLDPVPTRTPYPVVTLRGRAPLSRRVLVQGAGNPLASAVLPDDTFCVDVPLRTAGDYAVDVYGQASSGLLSDLPATATVTFDPAAPPIPGATTCSGADPAGCAGAVEICGNMRDDDCNGLTDALDPACATCMDDPLEPNDAPDAPRIEPMRYDNLKICPADEDYYGIYATTGQVVTARIFFMTSAGDLDLELFDTDGTTSLARSNSTTDTETVMATAAHDGQYVVRVFGYSGASNTYALDVRVGM